MRRILLLCLTLLTLTAKAQQFMDNPNDSVVLTEYRDGKFWVYKRLNGIVVGMTNNTVKEEYGKHYQIELFIDNLTDRPILFEPDRVFAYLLAKNDETLAMTVYTHEKYQKKIKNAQLWSSIGVGIAGGIELGFSNHHNYVVYSPANMYSLYAMDKMHAEDRKVRAEGYLKKTTVHAHEAIAGYMNIKRKKGKTMCVNIPIGEDVFSFEWDITPKK